MNKQIEYSDKVGNIKKYRFPKFRMVKIYRNYCFEYGSKGIVGTWSVHNTHLILTIFYLLIKRLI